MAKISAYGQTAISKWRDPATGTRYVLAPRDSYSPGRLLRKNRATRPTPLLPAQSRSTARSNTRLARGWQLTNW
jgi:hypothetical protein